MDTYNLDKCDIFLNALVKNRRFSVEDMETYKHIYSSPSEIQMNNTSLNSRDIEHYWDICSETHIEKRIEKLQEYVNERNKINKLSMGIITANLAFNIVEDIVLIKGADTNALMTSGQRKHFNDLIILLKYLKSRNIFNVEMFSSLIVTMDHIPLEVLWHLEMSSILPFIPLLKRNKDNDVLLKNVAHSILFLVFPPHIFAEEEDESDCSNSIFIEEMKVNEESRIMKTKVVGYLMLSMIRMVSYSSELVSGIQYEILCGNILNYIVEKIINTVLNHNVAPIDYFTYMSCIPSLVPGLLVPFAAHHLKVIFSHEPYVAAEMAITEQRKWSYSNTPRHSTDFFKNILSLLGIEKVSNILNATLKLNKTNWKNILMIVSLYVNMFPHGDQYIKSIINSHMDIGFSEYNGSSLMAVFLLARQCCSEKTTLFQSYLTWFASTFGPEASSVQPSATNKKSFMFLLEHLIKLVPHEPPAWLRVHINKLPKAPVDCSAELRDYVTLAKTRLADMKETCALGLFGTISVYEEDLAKLLSYYEQTGEIMPVIISASVMRHSYYEQVFLNKLLEGRKIPNPPDTKALFIEKLYSDGRIPKNMYHKYKEDCNNKLE